MPLENPYRLIASRDIYRNPWIAVREDHVHMPHGEEAWFGVVDGKPGSSVLAIDERNEVCLIREYKYGLGGVSIEVVSGGIEEGESELEAARRELREEVGLEAREWIPLGKVDPFTAVVKCPNYLWIARELEDVGHARDAGEVIEPFKVPLVEAVEMVMRSEVTHSTSCTLILKAARLYGVL